MFYIGAWINFNEFTHSDMLLKHRILIINLQNNYLDRPSLENEIKEHFKSRKNVIDQFENKMLFLKVALEMKFSADLFKKTLIFIELIRKKIKSDHILSPLKILWIKADFALIGNLLTLIGSGIFIFLGSILKTGSLSLDD